jgi:leucyl/phenylalanyl-tRNA--protein transferase
MMNLPIIKKPEQVTHVPIERTMDELSQEYGPIFIGPMTPSVASNSYKNGYFPLLPTEQVYKDVNEGFLFDKYIYCFPEKRGVLVPNLVLKANSSSIRRYNNKFTIKVNQNFKKVIYGCKTMVREEDNLSWINESYISSHLKLHKKGLAHSIEVYNKDKLVGGLYGVLIGSIFTAKSMFRNTKECSQKETNNASKVAIFALAQLLEKKTKHGYIDTMYLHPFLTSIGGQEISDVEFLSKLKFLKKMKIEL